jgi:hypothetical protein
MGDSGFKGAGEFGGQDMPHGCLPDYHFTKCPGRKRGLGGDDWTDKTEWCKYSAGEDADGKGFGYDVCGFCGDNYKECAKFPKEQGELEEKVE